VPVPAAMGLAQVEEEVVHKPCVAEGLHQRHLLLLGGLELVFERLYHARVATLSRGALSAFTFGIRHRVAKISIGTGKCKSWQPCHGGSRRSDFISLCCEDIGSETSGGMLTMETFF